MPNTPTIDAQQPKKNRRPPKVNLTSCNSKFECHEMVQNLRPDGNSDTLDGSLGVQKFGSKNVNKYTPEFIEFYKATYPNSSLSQIEKNKDPLIMEKFPNSTRFTKEYLNERHKNNKHVIENRSKAKLQNKELIKKIKIHLDELCCNRESILEHLSGSKVCFSCGVISIVNFHSVGCKKKETYCLKATLYSTIQFLDNYVVCSRCDSPFKGIKNHLKTCKPAKAEECPTKLYSKVLPPQMANVNEKLSESQVKNLKIMMDFKFVDKILASIISTYKNRIDKSQSNIPVNQSYYSFSTNELQQTVDEPMEIDESGAIEEIKEPKAANSQNLVPEVLLISKLENKSKINRVYSDASKDLIILNPKFDESSSGDIDDIDIQENNDAHASISSRVTHDGNIIQYDDHFFNQVELMNEFQSFLNDNSLTSDN